MYPNPPDPDEVGTRSAYSTYLHLLVNWLEHDAMVHLLGRDDARALLERDPIYVWINQQVLDNTDAIGEVVRAHGLVIEPDA